MGLFGKKETCCICGENEGSKKLTSGFICKECIIKCSTFISAFSLKDTTPEKVNKAIEETTKNNELFEIFTPTTEIDKYISFDENHRLWRINAYNIIFSYDDIISYELLENGDSVTKGGLGSAVVGGALFGGAGAIVGGITGKKRTKVEVNEVRLKIVTRKEMCPSVYIDFLVAGAIKSGSMLYNSYIRAAQDIITQFEIIADQAKENEKSNGNVSSNADEILKYKQLLDCGAITQDEFEAKKQQLLGL